MTASDAPMSWRRWTPVERDRVGGVVGGVAARSARSGRWPTTERTRPPAVRQVPSGIAATCRHGTRARPWSRPVEPVDASPRRGVVGIAGRREHDRDGRAGERRQHGRAGMPAPRTCGSAPRAAASSSGPSGDGQPRQDRLRLRVAEARVALEQDRARAAVSISPANSAPRNGVPRRASSARIGSWMVPRSAAASASGRSVHRAVRAHAARVRALVAVRESLVVAGDGQRRPPSGRHTSR